jgi:hypothetical protein
MKISITPDLQNPIEDPYEKYHSADKRQEKTIAKL